MGHINSKPLSGLESEENVNQFVVKSGLDTHAFIADSYCSKKKKILSDIRNLT